MNSSCFDFSMLLAKYVENGSRQHMASGNWCPHPVTFLFISWRNIKLIGGFDYLESLWSTAEFDEKKVREKFEQVDTWWRKGYDTTTSVAALHPLGSRNY